MPDRGRKTVARMLTQQNGGGRTLHQLLTFPERWFKHLNRNGVQEEFVMEQRVSAGRTAPPWPTSLLRCWVPWRSFERSLLRERQRQAINLVKHKWQEKSPT